MTEQKTPEAMDAFFNLRAEGYDAHMQSSLVDADAYYRQLAAPIIATAEPIEILDIGCGTGLEIPPVLEKAPNAKLTGMDLSAEMLGILREKFPGENIQVIKGSYLTHDFEAEKYEVILSSMTLHHLLPDQKSKLYRKLFNALKQGGVYIEGDYIVSHDKMNRLLDQYQALPAEAQGGTHHIDIPMSFAVQIDLLQQAGFEEVRKIYSQGENVILTARKLSTYPC